MQTIFRSVESNMVGVDRRLYQFCTTYVTKTFCILPRKIESSGVRKLFNNWAPIDVETFWRENWDDLTQCGSETREKIFLKVKPVTVTKAALNWGTAHSRPK